MKLGAQIDKSTVFMKVGSPLFFGVKLTKVASKKNKLFSDKSLTGQNLLRP